MTHRLATLQIIYFMNILWQFADSKLLTNILFQSQGFATTDSFADSGVGALPPLDQVTICARYRLLHSGEKGNPLTSYFAGDSDNEIYLTILWKKEKQTLAFHCCQSRVILKVSVFAPLYQWHHTCIAVDISTRNYWLAHNDMYQADSLPPIGSDPLQIFGEGRLVIGQDLDNLNGGMNYQQSIHGDVADYQLFDKVLDPSYLKEYASCRSPVTDSTPLLFFDAEMTVFQVVGATNVTQVTLETLCHKDSNYLYLLPEKHNFYSARDACARMKGWMAVPTSEEMNTKVFDDFIRFNDYCVDAWGTLYWLGFKGDLETGQWLTLKENAPLSWDNLSPSYDQVSEEQQCASVGGADFPYNWYSTPCEYPMCPLCNFTEVPSFRVRGLCKDSLIDRFLFLSGYKHEKPHFQGPLHVSMFWNRENETWSVENRAEEGLAAHMVPDMPGEYPIGINTWTFTGDKCGVAKAKLLITACEADEYTCDDGSCIPKAKRCDLSIDCSDQSDELACQLAQIPAGYAMEMPPPKDGDLPVPIALHVEITSVRQIDILGFKMVFDVIIKLSWRDSRLRMKNLRQDFKSNKVQDPTQIWLPKLRVEDGSRSLADIKLRSESLVVLREGSAVEDDDTKLYEDDEYLGSENTLVLNQVNTVDFTCQFQLQQYPFDSQRCSITFSLQDVSESSAFLVKDGKGVSFTGQKKLLEYEVTHANMTYIPNAEQPGQKLEVQLKNLYGYYISSTYIPTLLLVIICYLTLFFDIDDFTDRVMVSLTSLLVLAALFSQTSQTIPKTAYLKLVDLWFVFLIVIEFVIVLILVIVENFRLKKKKKGVAPNVTFISVSPQKLDLDREGSPMKQSSVSKKAVTTNTLAIFFVPTVMTIFIMGYSIACFVMSQ